MQHVDLLHHLDAELRRARDAAALAVARVEALRELRSRALSLDAARGPTDPPVTVDELLAGEDTWEASRWRALALRAFPAGEGGP